MKLVKFVKKDGKETVIVEPKNCSFDIQEDGDVVHSGDIYDSVYVSESNRKSFGQIHWEHVFGQSE